MAICRLCTQCCSKNGRLIIRSFREKVLDIICMWVDVCDTALPKDVCESCYKRVEEFYTYKRKCRSFQHAFTERTIKLPKKDSKPGCTETNGHSLQSPLKSPSTSKLSLNVYIGPTKPFDHAAIVKEITESFEAATIKAVIEPSREKRESCEAAKLEALNEQASKNNNNDSFDTAAVDTLKEPLREMTDTFEAAAATAPARKKRGRPRKTKETFELQFTPDVPKLKKSRKGCKLKPRLDAQGQRLVVPRPWRRKFAEAINLPVDEYRQYVLKNAVKKKANSICELCGRTIDAVRMDGHKNRHLGLEPYECDVCGDKFNCKLNMRMHHRRNHVQGEETACTICGKVFISKLALQSHMKGVHSERKFQCTICPLKCYTKSALNYHLKIHNQTRDFKCTLCPKAFYCKSVWTIHMRTHSGETPYQCSKCTMAYVHRNMYVAHMQKNHPSEPLMYLDGKRAFKESLLNKKL